jgi:hypothetical protein
LVRYDGASGFLAQRASGATLSDTLGLALNNASAFVSVGTAPAQSGAIRLENGASVTSRNDPSSADFPLLSTDSAETIQIGSNNAIQGDILLSVPTGHRHQFNIDNAVIMRVEDDEIACNQRIRLPNNTAIDCRNSANSLDLQALLLNASNFLQVGRGNGASGPSRVYVGADSVVSFWVAGSTAFECQATSVSCNRDILFIGDTGAKATTGTVRLKNNTSFAFRNAANSQDIFGLSVNASNEVVLGNSNASRIVASMPLELPSYTVTGAPSNGNPGSMIYVTDDIGGAVPAFDDGADWRRVTDRAVISDT